MFTVNYFPSFFKCQKPYLHEHIEQFITEQILHVKQCGKFWTNIEPLPKRVSTKELERPIKVQYKK